MRDRFAADCLGANKRDMVVIAGGLNDAGFGLETTWSAANHKTDLQEMVDLALGGGYTEDTIQIVSPAWIPDEAFNYGGSFVSSNRTVLLEYVEAATEVAQENGLWFTDGYAALRDNGRYAAMSGDLLHPNDRRHSAIANYARRTAKV